MTSPPKTPFKLRPNIRFESPDATTGYIWGKPTERSSILAGLNRGRAVVDPAAHRALEHLGIAPGDLVAERWLAADDCRHPSRAELPGNAQTTLPALIARHPQAMLGARHLAEHGPYLCTVMKLLDTHETPCRGALSVQVHPPQGYVGRPAKPEMWKGQGRLYLGWKGDMSEVAVRAAVAAGNVEQYMNAVDLSPGDLVVVPGGIVHAIRAGTFTAEWSMAPGPADAPGGNDLSMATATLYDGTDGRTPRPGKEDLASALDIMHRAGGLAAYRKFTVAPSGLVRDGRGNARSFLFRTAQVFVEQWQIADALEVPVGGRGFGLYVESGRVTVVSGVARLILEAGEEAFVPACAPSLRLSTDVRGAVVQTWYAPLAHEREAVPESD